MSIYRQAATVQYHKGLYHVYGSLCRAMTALYILHPSDRLGNRITACTMKAHTHRVKALRASEPPVMVDGVLWGADDEQTQAGPFTLWAMRDGFWSVDTNGEQIVHGQAPSKTRNDARRLAVEAMRKARTGGNGAANATQS